MRLMEVAEISSAVVEKMNGVVTPPRVSSSSDMTSTSRST
jgi:hypothetical protein